MLINFFYLTNYFCFEKPPTIVETIYSETLFQTRGKINDNTHIVYENNSFDSRVASGERWSVVHVLNCFPTRSLLFGRLYSRRSVVSMAFVIYILYSHKEWVIPSFLAKNKMFRSDYLFRNLISHTVKDKQQQTKPFVLEDLSCRSVIAMPFFKCPQQSANLITLTVKEMFSLPVPISNTVKK